MRSRSIIKNILLIFGMSLLIEVAVFNLRHWASLSNKPFTTDPYWIGEGLADNGDGTFTVGTGSFNIAYHTQGNELNNLCINIYYTDEKDDIKEPVTVEILATDEGHFQFYTLGKRDIFADEEMTKYTSVRLYGRAADIIISPELKEGRQIFFEVVQNPVVPFSLSPARLIMLFCLFLFIWAMRPSSVLHEQPYLDIKAGKRILINALITMTVLIIYGWIIMMSTGYHNEIDAKENQYQKLAEALSHGSVSLLEPVDPRLTELDNPYDPILRYETFKNDLFAYRWDNAYRDGKYYVYFGVVPVVVFYLPFYVITGHHIHNYAVTLILLCFLISGLVFLLDQLIKRYYRTCSTAMWFLSSLALIMGSYAVYGASRPDHYNIPILSALSFGVWGLWCFSKASEEGVENVPKMRYVVTGALFTALIAGCRPQLILFFILGLIIMKQYVFSREFLVSRKGRAFVISLALPVIITAILLMTYNHLRFGSVFNFGASYNLTLEDLVHRGFDIRRGIYGIMTIFLAPIRYTGQYPFIDYYIFPTSFMGQITQTATPGGIFVIMPFSLLSLIAFVYICRRESRRNPLILIAITGIISAFIICMLDTIRAGVFHRYYMDVSTLVTLSSICILWYILQNKITADNSCRSAVIWLIMAALIFEAVFFILSFMLVEDNGFISARPDLFYRCKSVFEVFL